MLVLQRGGELSVRNISAQEHRIAGQSRESEFKIPLRLFSDSSAIAWNCQEFYRYRYQSESPVLNRVDFQCSDSVGGSGFPNLSRDSYEVKIEVYTLNNSKIQQAQGSMV